MDILIAVLGGLSLFLYAIARLSETLKEALGDKVKVILGKCTGNLLVSVITGVLVTLILDSSSAVIIIAIILVNAKALTFRQAIGIVLGANIGTTLSSQLIALDIGKYSPIPIFLGMILIFISKSPRLTFTGRGIIYFGILFFGLYTMERAVEPLKSNADFTNWMLKLEDPVNGAGIGAMVTLAIQSSSATVGMVITLAKKGLLGLPAAIAVMIGAELGTCADTLLATIRSNRQALKTGLFHLIFNLCSVIMGLLLFPYFITLISNISGQASLQQKVANAHMLFNLLGVVIFLPFVPLVEKALNKVLPDKQPAPEKISVINN